MGMKKAILNDLIEIKERVDIGRLTNIDLNKEVRELTIKELSDISLILVNSVAGPTRIATAIEELTLRAIKNNKEIF